MEELKNNTDKSTKWDFNEDERIRFADEQLVKDAKQRRRIKENPIPRTLDDDFPESLMKKGKKKIQSKIRKEINVGMKTLQFFKLLDVYLRFCGSDVAVLSAIFESLQRYYTRNKRTDENGYFYFEHPKIKEKTGITKYRQQKAMKLLVGLGILHIWPENKGTPPKTFYRLDIIQYENIAQKLDRERQRQ